MDAKQSNNVLLHIKKKDSCNDKIEPHLFDKWKNEAKKRSKKKYQRKFVESGKHKEVQKKYTDKCKKDDKESHLQVRRQAQAKYVNSERVQKNTEDRLNEFKQLCIDILNSLQNGRTLTIELYRLIGQLASYKHPFNMVHLIPDEFKLKRKPDPTPSTWRRKPETFLVLPIAGL